MSYASLNAMKQNSVSRRDDLEAACYVCLKLFTGTTPWMEDYNKFREENRHITGDELKRHRDQIIKDWKSRPFE